MTPLLWQGTPYRHAEGVMDFLGWHDRWHTVLAKAYGRPIRRLDDLPAQLDWHQAEHVAIAAVLGLEAATDLSLYDLNQRQGFSLFMQVHSLEHERLREASGI